ncbi:hypothetical protein [Candidatus Uabimicrobium sp. HlEnr_7]|uniref:hypothetical protein n=1 Tax=Candidatus Uabimicrobium helgolandensis TaxID=3095367 RepID=UPI003557577D
MFNKKLWINLCIVVISFILLLAGLRKAPKATWYDQFQKNEITKETAKDIRYTITITQKQGEKPITIKNQVTVKELDMHWFYIGFITVAFFLCFYIGMRGSEGTSKNHTTILTLIVTGLLGTLGTATFVKDMWSNPGPLNVTGAAFCLVGLGCLLGNSLGAAVLQFTKTKEKISQENEEVDEKKR